MSAIAQRRTAAAAAIMMLFAVLQYVLLTVNPSPAGATDVTPQLEPGNPSCSGLGYDFGFKIDKELGPEDSGTYTEASASVVTSGTLDGSFSVTIDVYAEVAGDAFDWSNASHAVSAVISKGGPDANVYYYEPPRTSGDTGLHSPNNGPDKWYGLSHVEICLNNPPVVPVAAVTVGETCVPAVGSFTTDVTVSGWSNVDNVFVDGPGADDLTFTAAGTQNVSWPVGTYTWTATAVAGAEFPGGSSTATGSITVTDCSTPVSTQPPSTTPEPKSALGDLVWFDEDQNGRQDDPVREFPISGATVTLLSPSGTVLAQQVTSVDGLYLFDELEAGNYRVEVCAEGADYTVPNAFGVAEGVDSDVFPLTDKLGCSMTALINLPAGVTDLTWDAGLVIQVEGIQIEPTTTTIEPVTVETLPFTGLDVEDMVLLSMMVLAAGGLLLFAASLRDEEEADAPAAASGWSNR